MKTQIKFLSMVFVAALAFSSCMKAPMACCDVPATATHGQAVSFNSTCSMNASSYEWDFGDGSAKSTDANSTHTYTAAGTYTVKLMAMSKNGKKMNETTKSITIN
jgi:PKD repeat protein